MPGNDTDIRDRLVHDPDGFNTGCWPIRRDEFITPSARFFTRSHARAPRVDAASFALTVDGLVKSPRTLSLVELAAMPQREVGATLVCAGMRRSEFLALGPLPGELPWGAEAVGTGRWAGVQLRDVLELAGVAESARHVEFIGLDDVERHGHHFGFGGSIDLDKAMSPDVILATRLNGAALSPGHGYPLRAVVPGWIGARSVKWLGRIRLLDHPSENYFQTRAYRVQRETNPADPRDVSSGSALSAVPLNSVLLEPCAADTVRAGEVTVRGWAMGGGGAAVATVEVSANGRDWIPATQESPGGATRWTWTFWRARVTLPKGEHTLMVRATDVTGATQPEHVRDAWNVKGYVNNAWHRVSVTAD